jgi:hypothetical protein
MPNRSAGIPANPFQLTYPTYLVLRTILNNNEISDDEAKAMVRTIIEATFTPDTDLSNVDFDKLFYELRIAFMDETDE